MEKSLLLDWPMKHEAFSWLLIDMGGAIPRQVGPGCIRNVAK